ncbi:MAG: ABC transporter permease [Clostridium sp.]|nr:ABC transporter permease [Clostridium sp.]
MNNSFYLKIAWTNLKKNSKIYVPYILACICAVVTYYVMDSILLNEGLKGFRGADQLVMILRAGVVIIGIIAVIFLFYINSFLIKRRKKEIGIYNVLGMEKKHIARVLSIETIIIALVSLILGVLGGTILGKLLFLILIKLLRLKEVLTFSISPLAIYNTFKLFSLIFLAILIANLCSVKANSPMELLRGGNKGEKEPKASVVVAILGIIILATGYIMAITIDSPIKSFPTFFIATILVIIGTYITFVSGSIIFLKKLKKNKKFFYKTNNFVSVSGMLYRMKQNAVGLASICILSTAVLITLSTTISLYAGQEESLKIKYPYDIEIGIDKTVNNDIFDILTYAREEGMSNNVKVKDFAEYDTLELLGFKDGNSFSSTNIDVTNISNIKGITLYTEEEFNNSEVIINNNKFKVKKELEKIKIANENKNDFIEEFIIVVKDNFIIDTIEKSVDENSFKKSRHNVAFDVDGSQDDIMEFLNEVKGKISEYDETVMEDIFTDREEFYSVNGGFIFLGSFIGLLFIIGTVLIIYYKQISEGYDDSERFKIMQKVGMSKLEVKRTINKQILMVFFLPPLIAIVHIMFAFKIIIKLLSLFGMYSTSTLIIATCSTIFVFLILYIIVYRLTYRVYYKIVEQN